MSHPTGVRTTSTSSAVTSHHAHFDKRQPASSTRSTLITPHRTPSTISEQSFDYAMGSSRHPAQVRLCDGNSPCEQPRCRSLVILLIRERLGFARERPGGDHRAMGASRLSRPRPSNLPGRPWFSSHGQNVPVPLTGRNRSGNASIAHGGIAPDTSARYGRIRDPAARGRRARAQPRRPSDRARGRGKNLIRCLDPATHFHCIAPVAVHAYLADITSSNHQHWMPAHIAA